jgi:Methyltransferase domain
MAGDGAPGDPYDRIRVGYSLVNNRELVLRCLDAREARSVVEVGSERGLFTAELLTWAGERVRVAAVDPHPAPELLALAERSPTLKLVRSHSVDAIPQLPPFDAYILDGDHNYHTVSAELAAIESRAAGEFPLVLMHDVCWPHARRDCYHAPERIPTSDRQEIARDAWVSPWEDGLSDGYGIQYPASAVSEGGPRNGVLTAVEDFVATRERLRFARVPAFFGLGALWSRGAPWAGGVEEVIGSIDDHPVLERLEGNRITHLIERQRLALAGQAATARITALEDELRLLRGSRAVAIAERLSSISGSGAVSRARISELLDN